jgi:hypothetical protein
VCACVRVCVCACVRVCVSVYVFFVGAHTYLGCVVWHLGLGGGRASRRTGAGGGSC